MSETISISHPDEAEKIIATIHDCWFDVDRINHDQNSSELIIQFEKEMSEKHSSDGQRFFLKKIQTPIVECSLRIFHAIGYEIKDEKRVGKYDFNTLEYDDVNNILRITTGIPLGFQVRIDAFEITVEVSDNVIRKKKSFSIL